MTVSNQIDPLSHLSCPVCDKAGVNYQTIDICPQCESDLSIYRSLDQLEQNDPLKANNGSVSHKLNLELDQNFSLLYFKWPFITIATFSILVLLFLAFSYIQQNQFFESKLKGSLDAIIQNLEYRSEVGNQKAQRELAELNKKLEIFKMKIEELEKNQEMNTDKLAQKIHKYINEKDKEKSPFVQHVFGPKDNLWDLAKHYWGKGQLYPYFFEHNPNLSLNKTLPGTVVLIGPHPSREFSKSYLSKRGRRRYYNYLSLQKESISSLAKRLYGNNKAMINLLLKSNKHKVLKQNHRVWIPLPY